jgi:hypothetical protein
MIPYVIAPKGIADATRAVFAKKSDLEIASPGRLSDDPL